MARMGPGELLTVVSQWTRLFYTCFKYEAVRRVTDTIDSDEGNLIQEVSRLLGRALVREFGLEVTVRGTEHVQDLHRYCFAATHASYLDWFVILAYSPTAVRLVARKEIARFPVVGAYLQDQAILIDRSRGAEAREKLAASVDRAMDRDDRYPVLIFAEGTRSPDGDLQPFKRGGLSVMIERGLKVVPLVLKGTFDILPRHAYYLQERRPIHFEICPPVDPADFPDDRACIAEVERRVHEVWERG